MSNSSRKSSRRARRFRSVIFEPLEPRQMMAVDWRNPVDAIDVNNDRKITAFDALDVINELNLNGIHPLDGPKPADAPFLDATGNNALSAFDALAVINYLNLAPAGNYTLLEQTGQLATEQEVIITAGPLAAGARRYQLKVEAQFDTTDTQSASEDIFSVYLVNPLTGQTVVDAGSLGSSLFSLAGSQVAVKNGLVQWDGSLLTIDLSSLATTETLELRLQLLNVDGDTGTSVIITPWTNTVDPLGTPRTPGTLRSTPAQPAAAADLAAYFQIPGLTVEMENSSYRSSTGRFTTELRLFNNTAATVTNGVMRLPGLVAGVTAANASAVFNGAPYWNFSSLIGAGGLAPGAKTGWVQVTMDLPENQALLWRPEVLGYSSCDHLAAFGVFCGAITEAEEQHIFKLPLAKDDGLLILPMKVPGTTTATSPQTRMIRPLIGAEASFNFPTSLRGTFDKYDVERTGDYQFELTGRATGDFSVAFHQLNNAEELTLGSQQSGVFDPRLGAKVFTFQGTAGQTILIENRLPASQARNGVWKLFTAASSQQSPWFGTTAGDQEFYLSETGSYYLIFSPPDFTTTLTPYDFLVRTPVETQHAMSFGTTQNVTFDSAGHRHLYSFTGTANQQVVFDSLLPPTDPTRFELLSPWGDRRSIVDAKPNLLNISGTWQLLVRGDQPGTFSFRMYNVADLPVITSGGTISGTVGQYDSDFYRVPSVAGELLDLVRTSTDPAEIKITGPAIQFVGRPNFGDPYRLLFAGDNVVQVHVVAGETADRNYSFDATKSLAAPVTNTGLDVDYLGTISPGTSTLTTFTASAGMQIWIDAQQPVGSTSNIQYSLFGGGHSAPLSGDSQVLTLTESGTYSIRGWNQSLSPQPYAFRIINLNAAPLLTDGDLIDEVLTGYRDVVRRVEGYIDDRMILDMRGSSTIPINTDIKLATGFNEIYPYHGGTSFDITDLQSSGTQYLIMEQGSASDVTLSLQARFERNAPVLPLGTPIVGAFDANNGSQMYKFRVQAGQTLYLDSLLLSNPGAVKVQVSNHRLDPQTIDTTRAATWHFDEAGDHYLWIKSDVSTPAEFTVRASFLPTTTIPLVFDAVTTGTLAAGERHVYSFAGKQGQVVYIDGIDETSPAAQLTLWRNDLFNPDSQRTTAANGTYPLLSDGHYRIVVGELVGTYEFRVVDVNSLPLIPLDVSLQGSIAADERDRLWRFPADYAQRIVVDSNASLAMPFEGTMAMYDARGALADTTSLRTNNDLDDDFQYEGNNLLVMSAGTVPYNYDVRIRTAETTSFATSVGTVNSGVLQDPYDVFEYTFAGTAGQHLQMTGSVPGSITFFDPDGNQMSAVEGYSYLLRTSGEYRMRVAASGVQVNTPYQFQIVDVAALPLLPLNTPIARTHLGESLLYRLPAAAGQRYQFDFVTLSGSTVSNNWRLIGPEATTIFTTTFINGDRTVTVPETGDHLLIISMTAGAVDYTFQVNELTQPTVTVAGLNQTYSDSVVLQERKNVEFTGYAGQQVLLDVLNQTTLQPVTRLLAPDGSIVDSSAQTDELYILPFSGAYKLEFYANGAASPLNYSVRLIDASSLPVTPHNAPFAINFDQTHKGEVWAFHAMAGDLLGFDLAQITLNGSFRVVEPDGKSFSVDSSSRIVPMTKTGRHYLVMNGGSQPTPVLGTGQIWNPNLLPAITTEDPIVVSFAGKEWHYFSFDLAAGERVFFTPVTPLPSSTTVLFRGPRNQNLTISLDDSVTPDVFTVTRAGRHTLFLSRSVTTAAEFTFRIHKAAIRETFGVARDYPE